MAETLGSVERAIETLMLFGADRPEIGVTELARLLGCSTSSAQRTIHTLTRMQFLRRNDDRAVYQLGAGVLHLARAWQGTASLASITRPVIAELAERTGFMAAFAVADHAHMRAVVAVDGTEGPLRAYPIAGELFPAHVGAISKAYYAFLPKQLREHYTAQRPLARYTLMTSMDPETLEAEFRRIRDLGYCATQGEYDEQVSAFAMPVRLSNDPLGSVAVSTKGELEVTESLIEHTRAATRAIARLLARRNPGAG